MTGLRELAVDAIPAAFLIIDNGGSLTMANAMAQRLLSLSAEDIGRPFEELEIASQSIDLRDAVRRVLIDGAPLVQERVPWTIRATSLAWLDVHLVPVVDPKGTKHGVALTFMDVSLAHRLQDELQSMIEELETTTEELQSTNTGLESMRAELQFTSEEMQSLSDALRTRTAELIAADDLLESMLIGQRNGLVVIDRGLRVSVWNDRSAELWGLQPREASGRHFLNLDVGLPVEDLREPIMAVLAGHSERETAELDAVTRRGRDFRCRVSVIPLSGQDRQIRGAIILTEDLNSRESGTGPEAEAAERSGQNP